MCAGDRGPEESNDPDEIPWLGNLHEYVAEYLNARVVDGDDLRFSWSARGSEHFPWETLTEMLVSVWALVHRPSRQSLQMLLNLLRFVDRRGRRFDPDDVPRSSEHLISRMRQRLPLLRVCSRLVKDKAGNDTQAMDIPFNLLLRRMFDCPRVMEEYRENFAGHVMSSRERRVNRVPDDHLTPVPTRHVDGERKSFMNGDILKSSSHMGIECVLTAGEGGAGGVRVMVGDTVMARISADAADQAVPCRLAGLFWQENTKHSRRPLQLARGKGGFWGRYRPTMGDEAGGGREETSASGGGGESTRNSESWRESGSSGSSGSTGSSGSSGSSRGSESSGSSEGSDSSGSSGSRSEGEGSGSENSGGDEGGVTEERGGRGGRDTGHLVARVNRLMLAHDMPHQFKAKRRLRQDNMEHVWEITGAPEEVKIDAIEGICRVLPVDDMDADAEDMHVGVQRFLALGFVVATPRANGFKVVMEPWRKSGVDGWFFDRRSDSVHANSDSLPVFSAGLVCASDGFNYFSLGGRNFSVNATYTALGCLSPALTRRLRSWYMCSLGAPGARWEEDIGPFMSIIKMLQNGCRARVENGGPEPVTVSVFEEIGRFWFILFTGGYYIINFPEIHLCVCARVLLLDGPPLYEHTGRLSKTLPAFNCCLNAPTISKLYIFLRVCVDS